MKKRFCKSMIAVLLVLVMMTTVCCASMTFVGAKQLDVMPVVSAGRGSFSEDTSFLTKEEYQKLSMNLGDASTMDNDPLLNPLLGSENRVDNGDVEIIYTGEVTYGWSNPQLVAVMMSAPYWNELKYGEDMSAAGEATFKLSTSYGTSQETTTTTNIGITFAGEGEVSGAGNGVVFGGSLEISNDAISSTVTEKSKTVGLTHSTGADKDSAVVCVAPLAVYKYVMYDKNVRSEFYVQAPVGTVYSVATLDNYNSVARSVNDRLATETMLEVNLKDICPDYVTGDPSTYFGSAHEMPTSFAVLDGRLVRSDKAEIEGDVYSTGSYVSITAGQGSSAGTLTYSCEESNGYTNGSGYTLDASVYGGITVGFDMFGITNKGTATVGIKGGTSVLTSTSVMDTYGLETSVTYVNLPDLSSVSDDVKASYGFSASQLVWYPTSVSENTIGCPVCIISSAVLPGDNPLFLPDDMHVSAVRNDSVTLSWSNKGAGDRLPEYFEVVEVVSSGNVSSNVVRATVDSNSESVTVDGLSENTNYSFALRAVSADDMSVVGPSVNITTSFDSMPVITKQPTDTFVYLGETAVLSVKAQPYFEGSQLSYQWQKLSVDRYSTSFKNISNADSDTLELSTYNMDSTVYRCVVTETNDSSVMNTVSDCAKVNYGYKISNYEDLCFITSKINSGHPDYVYGSIIVSNDFSIPQGEQWTTPIGSGSRFKGTFDGRGYTISGLNSTVGGLFDKIENATIKNLNLENVNINVHGEDCSALCTDAYGNSVISGCTVQGNIKVSSDVGEEPWAVAGICANLYSASIVEKCINYCDVAADAWYIAGVCGDNLSAVRNCANRGNIKGYEVNYDYMNKAPADCGGVVAYNRGEVENCYNTGSFSGTSNNRSIVAEGNAPKNCYYLSTVAGDSNATAKTLEQFISGEVTYLLNRTSSIPNYAWFQSLDNSETPDEFPTLSFARNKIVFKVDREDRAYSNTPNGYLLGDTDLDGSITVMDATLIQLHCAQLYELTGSSLVNADANKDYIVSITDATRIQLHVAEILPIE